MLSGGQMNHILGLFLLILLTTKTTQAANFTISSVKVGVGSTSGNVSSLSAADSKLFQFYTNGKGNLTIDFQAKVNSSQSMLQVLIRMKQKQSSDVFMFSYKEAAGTYKDIGSLSGSAGVFKDYQFSMSSAAIINGVVSLRFKSNRGADDGQIDLLVIQDSAVVTPPPPPTEPSPQPEPTPIPQPPAPTPTPPSTSLGPKTSWYWQLQGTLNTAIDVKVYDIDLYDTSAATIQALKASGKFVVCYFSAGSYENWRSDANQFPAIALGNNLDGWAGEKWLDVRNSDVRNIMAKRMDLAKSKGCHALEPDNVDGFSNRTGFPLTANDQINYLSYLADQAHARGMQIALKNSTDLVSSLVDKFDFAVVEECFKYNECEAYSPFIQKGKAVLNAEYSSYSTAICTKANNLKFSTVFFNLDLNGKVFQPCP